MLRWRKLLMEHQRNLSKEHLRFPQCPAPASPAVVLSLRQRSLHHHQRPAPAALAVVLSLVM